jgi:hypothetical protein
MAGGGMSVPQLARAGHSDLAELPLAAAGVGTVRPGRVRNRPKAEPDDKVKKPADGVPKKSPPTRKAPSRGRYVDEYARPGG